MNEIIDEEWALLKAFVLSFFDNFQLNREQPMNQPTKQQTEHFIEVKMKWLSSTRQLNASSAQVEHRCNGQANEQMVGQVDGQTNGWLEKSTDGLKDRRTHLYIKEKRKKEG